MAPTKGTGGSVGPLECSIVILSWHADKGTNGPAESLDLFCRSLLECEMLQSLKLSNITACDFLDG